MDNPNNKIEDNISFGAIRRYYWKLVKDFVDLSKGVDKWSTIREIKSKQAMSGANAWMLMCSIIIVSIGLNLNSQAVIIGAMLISPLMSPILGIGLAVAINDKDALYNALMHFGAAILIAIIFSTGYFILTPLDSFTEQMSARTEPTFLDVLIAIFGGIAGIVSIARKDISTTLPGVAIATALMPPLCVSGYGLAHGSMDVALKSFYLFFINSFFVAFATYAIIRYLKFPFKEHETQKARRKNIFYVSFFSLIMIIPSFLIFSSVFKEAQQEKRIKGFIDKYIGENYIYLDDYELLKIDDENKKLVMKVYGDSIRKSKIPYYEEGLKNERIENTTIEIIPTSEINLKKVRQLETQLSEVGQKINSQLMRLEDERNERDLIIQDYKDKYDFMKQDSTMFGNVTSELNIFLPDIKSIHLAISQFSDFKHAKHKIPLAVVEWAKPTDPQLRQLESYLKQAYSLDTIVIITQ